MKWLSTIKHADEGKLVRRADGARRDRLPAADRRARGARGGLARARARPGDRPLAARRRAGPRGRGRRRAGRAGHDDRPPGIFAGGDMVPAERTVTVAVGHGKKAARHIDAWLRGVDVRAGAEARARRASSSSTPGTTPTRRARCSRSSSSRGASRPSRRSSAGSTSRTRCSRRAAASRAATASRATTASASAPTTPCSSSTAPGRAVRDRPRLLQGLRHLRRRMPVRRDRDGARDDLDGDGPHRATAAHGAAPSSIDRARRGRLSTLPARHEPPVPRAWDAGGL